MLSLLCVQGADRLSQLQDLLQKVYMRRTKAIIADQLPKKKVNICSVEQLSYPIKCLLFRDDFSMHRYQT